MIQMCDGHVFHLLNSSLMRWTPPFPWPSPRSRSRMEQKGPGFGINCDLLTEPSLPSSSPLWPQFPHQ